MNLSEYLLAARKRAKPVAPGMGRSEAARALGVSRMSLIAWERGALPDESRLPTIAAAYGVDVEELRALWDAERSRRVTP